VDIIDFIHDVPQLGVHGILIIIVYLLGREVKAQKKMLIDCLQSGGKVSEEEVDSDEKLI